MVGERPIFLFLFFPCVALSYGEVIDFRPRMNKIRFPIPALSNVFCFYVKIIVYGRQGQPCTLNIPFSNVWKYRDVSFFSLNSFNQLFPFFEAYKL